MVDLGREPNLVWFANWPGGSIPGWPVLDGLAVVRALRRAGDDLSAEQLLRGMVTARPKELLFLMALAQLLRDKKPARLAERCSFIEEHGR